MKAIINLALSLGIICLIGAAALAFVKQSTEQPIRNAEKQTLMKTLSKVLPAEVTETASEPKVIDGVKFFAAKNADGTVIAYAAEAVSIIKGFGGPITVVAGVSPDGKILNAMISQHTETPGLGTKATDRVATKSFWDLVKGKIKNNPFPPNKFLDAYQGVSQVIVLDRDIPRVTGATYSSRAVNSAINAIIKAAKSL